MAQSGQTIEERLLPARLAINNTLADPDILADWSQSGYDEAKLNEGKVLLVQAEVLVEQQKVEYGEQFEASQTLAKAQQAADKT